MPKTKTAIWQWNKYCQLQRPQKERGREGRSFIKRGESKQKRKRSERFSTGGNECGEMAGRMATDLRSRLIRLDKSFYPSFFTPLKGFLLFKGIVPFRSCHLFFLLFQIVKHIFWIHDWYANGSRRALVYKHTDKWRERKFNKLSLCLVVFISQLIMHSDF